MKGKKCPRCSKKFGDLHLYCSRCGLVLEEDINRCSEKKSALCERGAFDRDDDYCSYCGALTTYAAERRKLFEATQ